MIDEKLRAPRRGRRLLSVYTALMALLLITAVRADSATARDARFATRGPARRVNASELSRTSLMTIVVPPATPGLQWSWALLDERSGTVAGSENDRTTTSYLESTIKAGISAAVLGSAERLDGGPAPDILTLIMQSVRYSDDRATERLYRSFGGDALVDWLISRCELRSALVISGWWSLTEMTAADLARLGACIAANRLASPRWTSWLIGQMYRVDPYQDFGIAQAPALAGQSLAVKNGWTLHLDSQRWYVNCLAIGTSHVLAVMTSYPAANGRGYGAAICRGVGQREAGPLTAR